MVGWGGDELPIRPMITAYDLVWSPKYHRGLLMGELAKRVEELFREAHDIAMEELEI